MLKECNSVVEADKAVDDFYETLERVNRERTDALNRADEQQISKIKEVC